MSSPSADFFIPNVLMCHVQWLPFCHVDRSVCTAKIGKVQEYMECWTVGRTLCFINRFTGNFLNLFRSVDFPDSDFHFVSGQQLYVYVLEEYKLAFFVELLKFPDIGKTVELLRSDKEMRLVEIYQRTQLDAVCMNVFIVLVGLVNHLEYVLNCEHNKQWEIYNYKRFLAFRQTFVPIFLEKK